MNKQKLVLTFGIILVFCASSSAQNAELERLRAVLNVPDSTVVEQSRSSLPSSNPLKVYLAIGSDPNISKAFVTPLNEWNKKNGSKYGTLEVVGAFSDAEVALVWYSNPPEAINHAPKTYSYVIVRQTNKVTIVTRIVIEGYQLGTDTQYIGDSLRSAFFKKLKSRPSK